MRFFFVEVESKVCTYATPGGLRATHGSPQIRYSTHRATRAIGQAIDSPDIRPDPNLYRFSVSARRFSPLAGRCRHALLVHLQPRLAVASPSNRPQGNLNRLTVGELTARSAAHISASPPRKHPGAAAGPPPPRPIPSMPVEAVTVDPPPRLPSP